MSDEENQFEIMKVETIKTSRGNELPKEAKSQDGDASPQKVSQEEEKKNEVQADPNIKAESLSTKYNTNVISFKENSTVKNSNPAETVNEQNASASTESRGHHSINVQQAGTFDSHEYKQVGYATSRKTEVITNPDAMKEI